MIRRSGSNTLLALLAMLATLVEPAANVLHGLEHAAEAARHHPAPVAVTLAASPSQANLGARAAMDETDHDAEFHATLHGAASTDLSSAPHMVAVAGAQTLRLAMTMPAAHGVKVAPDAHPPDYGLRSIDLARAPPVS